MAGAPAAAALLAAALLAAAPAAVRGLVVGAVLVPHGAVILDPRNAPHVTAEGAAAAARLREAALQAGQFVQELEPELLLLVTPHGLAVREHFLLYDCNCKCMWGVAALTNDAGPNSELCIQSEKGVPPMIR
jgi:hypothetical protein